MTTTFTDTISTTPETNPYTSPIVGCVASVPEPTRPQTTSPRQRPSST